MRLGVVFPPTEIGRDPDVIARFARRVEEFGFSYIVIYDHVVGTVREDREPSLSRAIDEESTFHEPMVTLAYLAAVTSSLGLMTGVLVLPQRQTVLVAKQAAQLALLSKGRLRLGVGVGWNPIEYESLNERFDDRAGRASRSRSRCSTALWTRPVVDFAGRWHRVNHAGIRPLPPAACPSGSSGPVGSRVPACSTAR